MPEIETVLSILGYNDSQNFIREQSDAPVGVYSVLRQLKRLGDCTDKEFSVEGVFIYETSRKELDSSYQIALCVADVESQAGLEELRRVVWNTGSIPFLLANTDGAVKLYQTFSYEREEKSLIDDASLALRDLAPINAEGIESGRIWQSSLSAALNPKQRVDQRLLTNLEELREFACQCGIPKELVHRLIGKYIYFRYLKDRGILSDRFLELKGLANENVFSSAVTVDSFQRFSETLEERFNGKIFAIDFEESQLKSETLSLFAEVFSGKIDLSGDSNRKEVQLAFDFMDYDFEFIPVELLSKVYELFLHDEDADNQNAAYYTPEYLAEYVLHDVNEVFPLQKKMRILDPACGSGIFLSLAFKHIIECRLKKSGATSFNPVELRQLLEDSIFGVEINTEAAEVTAFSLILTLLHYVEPPALHKHHRFRFPSLIGRNILNHDFFDPIVDSSWEGIKFDWVIGNPPWKTVAKRDRNDYCGQWMLRHRSKRPIANKRIEHAFVWRALDWRAANGAIGFVLPSAGWVNDKAVKFRKSFLSEATVYKITNLSHVRRLIFEKAIQPPSVWIYGAGEAKRNIGIKHFAPKSIHLPTLQKGALWAITVSESDIHYVERAEVANGSAVPWKIAQWGCSLDPMILRFLDHQFTPLISYLKHWGFPSENLARAPEFKTLKEGEDPPNGWEYLPEFVGIQKMDTKKFNRFDNKGIVFTLPNVALRRMAAADSYLRKRGGRKGLAVCRGPHLYIGASWGNAFIVKEEDFVIPSRHFGIGGKSQYHTAILKMLAIYFSSSLVKYWMFFHNPEMGESDSKNRITLSHLKEIPVPDFTEKQVRELAATYDSLVLEEATLLGETDSVDLNFEGEINESARQRKIDRAINRILKLPVTLRNRIQDFAQFDILISENPNRIDCFRRRPTAAEIKSYGEIVVKELDGFAEGELYHRAQLTISTEMICCELSFETSPIDLANQVSVGYAEDSQRLSFRKLKQQLTKEVSPAFYLQRNIRIYASNSVQIFKPTVQIDWSKTQAYVDAGLVISEALNFKEVKC